MARTPPARTLALAGLLLLSLGASALTWWRNTHSDVPAESVAHGPAATAASAPQATPMPAEAPRNERTADATPDLFAPVNWDEAPPPAPAPAPAAPAPPQAPPLPFEFVGRTEVADGRAAQLVHLRRGTELFSVRAGERIDDQYRLDSIGPDSLEIAYLPMNIKHTLQTGVK
jgi:hypothetical protein